MISVRDTTQRRTISLQDILSRKRFGHPVHTKVTWRKDNESTYIRQKRHEYGDGPFLVSDETRATYGTPRVQVKDQNGMIIPSPEQNWFYSSMFEKA